MTEQKFRPLTLGQLPVEALKQFGLELTAGHVAFTIPAQKHAFERHPDTYMSCLPFLSQTVTEPTHVGQSPNHTDGGFELVREVTESGLIVLVAVLIKPTKKGIYLVKSTYPIDYNKLGNRVRRGHLISVQ
ncbi:hypothetical protein [Ochrobactrum soli]|uniref:hypothetical protein n=1 Tax=Ochrobactrum soli TaxID=2448455 RepID=UPI0011B25C8A|nr:hypothetical protein [[Ochrobactrum] soli]